MNRRYPIVHPDMGQKSFRPLVVAISLPQSRLMVEKESIKVGDRIRGQIAERRLSRAELAEVWALSMPATAARINGKQAITVGQLVLAAQWMDCDPSELLKAAA